ncbi:MAG: tetratricopeptide repeat protein [Verrucomicrobiales bacterium]|nr:tetratricopeptide repeat protein [Verrucomicrobiales bacterium]
MTRSYLPILFLVYSFLFPFSATQSDAKILDYFKRDLSKVPTKEKLKTQEPLAKRKLDQALTYEKKGLDAKAATQYQYIIKNYPFTSSAPTSQYKLAEHLMKKGKLKKAFEAFQDFVDKYKSSSLYIKAIQAQYKIARSAQERNSNHKIFFLPKKFQQSVLLEWFTSIIDNAPFSPLAPLAQFAIAELYENDDKPSQAIAAYQSMVDKHPNHSKSPEAQFRIGEIARKKIEAGSRDHANIVSARNAMEDVIVAYENSPRAKEAKIALARFDSIEAKQFYETAVFYEKQNQLRSAVIYYEKAAKAKDPEIRKNALKKLSSFQAPAPVRGTPKKNELTGNKPGQLNPEQATQPPVPSVTEKEEATIPNDKKGPVILPPPPAEN